MKKLFLIIIGFILGATVCAFILIPQIQNRYEIGRNQGQLDGGFAVIDFLNNNLKNDLSEEVVDTDRYLDFKDARIFVIEINGIKTIQIR